MSTSDTFKIKNIMKKLLIFAFLIIFATAMHGQIVIDSIRINIANVVAADTIIQFETEQMASSYAISINYTTVNADDGVVDILVANQRGVWQSLDDINFPHTMNVTANTDTLTNKASVGIHGDELAYPFVGIRLNKVSATAGIVDAKRVFTISVNRSRSARFP